MSIDWFEGCFFVQKNAKKVTKKGIYEILFY